MQWLTALFLIVKEQLPWVYLMTGPGRCRGAKLRGAEGDRTPDLLVANQTLSQLSYSPGRMFLHSTGDQPLTWAPSAPHSPDWAITPWFPIATA